MESPLVHDSCSLKAMSITIFPLDRTPTSRYTTLLMSIRIAHLSDTHLGFQDLELVNAEGINAREADIYQAWHTAVDMIIKEKPDILN
ncbi:MAG: hypothetical protein JW904_00315 [Spirochaetales bacterium]|nr:hypothetical protein [Spirochaetales bacterium]